MNAMRGTNSSHVASKASHLLVCVPTSLGLKGPIMFSLHFNVWKEIVQWSQLRLYVWLCFEKNTFSLIEY